MVGKWLAIGMQAGPSAIGVVAALLSVPKASFEGHGVRGWALVAEFSSCSIRPGHVGEREQGEGRGTREVGNGPGDRRQDLSLAIWIARVDDGYGKSPRVAHLNGQFERGV
ncbi:hypothetical protein V8F33_006797 [Rhypophila sp. PSN 637]